MGRARRSSRYDLVIIGLGSGGMVAAELAATLGLRVAAVERHRVGGDCLWTGCVPSKALLAAAHAADVVRHADRWGLAPHDPGVDLDAVFQRIRAVQGAIATTDDDPDRFAAMGVELVRGSARITGPTTVLVDGTRALEARTILVCTGSRPVMPAIPGLADVGLTSETLWDVASPPRSLVVLGGGPIGVEIAQAFARLGAPVTVLQQGATILPRDEPELVAALSAALVRDGVEIHLGATATEVRRLDAATVCVTAEVDGATVAHTAEAVFVAAGRTPNVEGLGLDEVGVDVGATGITVDDHGRTAVPSIYAVGDVVGRYRFTHSAGHEAALAVRTAFFPGAGSRPELVPWCTFTDPELAHAGLTVAEARARNGERVEVWRLPLERNDRARTDATTEGAIVIVTAKGRIVGAHVLAPQAGDIIHELVLAIHQGMKLTDLAGMLHIYPTLALGIGQLATEAAYRRAGRLGWLARLSARSSRRRPPAPAR